MLKVNVTIPWITGFDFDTQLVERAMEEAIRAHMRRKGLGRGQNMAGAQSVALRAAASETKRALDKYGVDWYPVGGRAL